MQHTLIGTPPYIHTYIHTHIHADIITYAQTFENIPRLHTHMHTYIQTLAHTHLILPGCVGSLCVCQVPKQTVACVDVENQTKNTPVADLSANAGNTRSTPTRHNLHAIRTGPHQRTIIYTLYGFEHTYAP